MNNDSNSDVSKPCSVYVLSDFFEMTSTAGLVWSLAGVMAQARGCKPYGWSLYLQQCACAAFLSGRLLLERSLGCGFMSWLDTRLKLGKDSEEEFLEYLSSILCLSRTEASDAQLLEAWNSMIGPLKKNPNDLSQTLFEKHMFRASLEHPIYLLSFTNVPHIRSTLEKLKTLPGFKAEAEQALLPTDKALLPVQSDDPVQIFPNVYLLASYVCRRSDLIQYVRVCAQAQGVNHFTMISDHPDVRSVAREGVRIETFEISAQGGRGPSEVTFNHVYDDVRSLSSDAAHEDADEKESDRTSDFKKKNS